MCVRAWDPETETLVELRDAEEAERWGVGTQSAFVWVAILVLCRVMCECECVCVHLCVCVCVSGRGTLRQRRWLSCVMQGVGFRIAFVWVVI